MFVHQRVTRGNIDISDCSSQRLPKAEVQ